MGGELRAGSCLAGALWITIIMMSIHLFKKRSDDHIRSSSVLDKTIFHLL